MDSTCLPSVVGFAAELFLPVCDGSILSDAVHV
jgi:hypothetical protein